MMLTIKVPTSLIKFNVGSQLAWRHSDNGRLARLRLLRDMLDAHTEETISVDEELFKFLDL
jgi:hypothetical protein